MIVFDNSLGKGKAKPPAALSGGESSLENHRNPQPGDALTCVGDVDKNLAFASPQDLYRNGAGIAHGVDGVLAKVFDYPFEQRNVYPGRNRSEERRVGKESGA